MDSDFLRGLLFIVKLAPPSKTSGCNVENWESFLAKILTAGVTNSIGFVPKDFKFSQIHEIWMEKIRVQISEVFTTKIIAVFFE